MSTRQAPINEPRDVEERRQRSAADDAREQLLAGLPVSERRLQLASISTAVLRVVTGSILIGCASKWASAGS